MASVARGADTSDPLAAIPTGAQYDMVRYALELMRDVFPEQYATLTPDRIQGWVDEIDSGVGRDAAEIRSDIFEFVVTPEEIQQTYGVNEEQAQELIAGTMTFAELGEKVVAGTEMVGGTVIPEGAQLIKVNNPAGSDAGSLYYLTYEWQGVTWTFEVGDAERLDELFGGEGAFDEKRTMNQQQFDNAGFVSAGSADQILGADESFTALMERETAAVGMEDLPEWLAGSPQAMSILAQGAAQGWSPSRIWEELSTTDAFQDRYGTTIGIYTQGGSSIQDAVQQILADEQSLARVVRRYGPPGASYDSDYFQSALAQGWDATAAAQVLEATNQLTRNPTALRDANAVLAAAGLAPVDEAGMLNIMLGGAPDDVTEAINTANADRALRDAGLMDVDIQTLLDVVDTTDRVLTVESFREIAGELAFNFARFSTEMDRNAFGVSRDDLTRVMFGEAPNDATQGEILNALARFERDRRRAAQGFGGATAFVDDRNQLRFQGVGG